MTPFTKHISTGLDFGKKAIEIHSFATKMSHFRSDHHHQNEPKEKVKQTIEKR